jgi:hypothetical protein
MSFPIFDQSLIQIKMISTYLGQAVLNVFYFLATTDDISSPLSPSSILSGFDDNYASEILPRVTNAFRLETLELTLLDSPDFPRLTLPYGANGGGLFQSMPSYVCLSVQMTTGSRAVRAGSKRFAGIPEDQVAGNDMAPAYVGSWQGLVNGWVDGFRAGSDEIEDIGTILPIVVSSKNWVNGVPTVYRRVQENVVKSYVTTQNSRKRGYGI